MVQNTVITSAKEVILVSRITFKNAHESTQKFGRRDVGKETLSY